MVAVPVSEWVVDEDQYFAFGQYITFQQLIEALELVFVYEPGGERVGTAGINGHKSQLFGRQVESWPVAFTRPTGKTVLYRFVAFCSGGVRVVVSRNQEAGLAVE